MKYRVKFGDSLREKFVIIVMNLNILNFGNGSLLYLNFVILKCFFFKENKVRNFFFFLCVEGKRYYLFLNIKRGSVLV